MNEKRICIVCVIMIFVIMTGYHFEKKFEEEISMEPDVVSSIRMNRDQYLTVVANREMCTENSFHTIKFSTDRGYATSIHMQVYLCDNDIEEAKVAMKIDYVQREYNEKYDICNNPEEFELHVDGEVIN